MEAQEYIATSDCPDYLKKAERRLAEEATRVAHYLDTSTEAKITAVVERELLGSNLRMLVEMPNSGLVPLLEHDKVDDLRRMFGLLRRGGVQGGLAGMCDIMVRASLRTSPIARDPTGRALSERHASDV